MMKNQIHIQKTLYKVTDFITWLKNDQLALSPEFQRRAVWKKGAKSFLIDTIVKGMPIPIIFLRDRRLNIDQFEPIREVVDGQQRLRTMLSFVCPQFLKDYDYENDYFTVSKSHNKSIAGKEFSALDDESKKRILEYEFNVHILPSSLDDRDVIQIFRRMNSTNYTLNTQEKRNANFFGEYKSTIYEMAAEQLHRWRRWGIFSSDNIARMLEVELTSELVSSMISNEISGKSQSKIDKPYEQYDDDFPMKEEVVRRFQYIMDIINDLFIRPDVNFAFNKRTLFYTFYMALYNLFYGLKSDLVQKLNENQLSGNQIAEIKKISDGINERTIAVEILEATDRRTTNPKERKILYDFIVNKVNNA